MATKQLHSEVSIKNTKIVGTLVGKAFVDTNGTVGEKYIIRVDPRKLTLQELAPFLGEIVIDPSQVAR